MRDVEAAYANGAGFRPFVEMRREAIREARDGCLAAAGRPAQQRNLAFPQRKGYSLDTCSGVSPRIGK